MNSVHFLFAFGFSLFSFFFLSAKGQINSPDVVSANRKFVEYLTKYHNKEQIFKQKFADLKKRNILQKGRSINTQILIDQILQTVLTCNYSQSMKYHAELCQMEREIIHQNQLQNELWAYESKIYYLFCVKE